MRAAASPLVSTFARYCSYPFIGVWDHLFGTFKLPATQLGPTDVGLKEKDFPIDYETQLIYPFVGTRMSLKRVRRFEQARAAYARETATALASERRGDVAASWRAYELAHVIAQPHLGLHLHSHLFMLCFAWRLGRWNEMRAQMLRLLVVPIGQVLGRTPLHNVGTGRVGLTQPGEWPAELSLRTLERQ